MLNKGTVLTERYEIIEKIGSGGMADVYRAMDHKLNRYVAIKVLKREFREDKQFVAKFKQEARAVAGLSHPNIVNVYDVGNEGTVQFIVLELVEGITLKKYIEKKGHLPYKEAVSIAIQVANGIEAAHEHHIVHRDIKPQNIIISREGKVKVTDFGIAKAATSTATVSTSAMGSVHYMSPEQARGGYSDERSDIYSFGITLFEMLTGQVPFDGETTVAVAVHHIQDEIDLPSELVSGIPVSVDKIVQKCTKKKVDARYQSMGELIADLKKSLIMPDEDFVQEKSPFVEEEVYAEEKTRTTEKEGKPTGDTTTKLPDIDNERNKKLDVILKWVAIGVAAAVVVIIVVFALRGCDSENPEPTETTESTELQIEIPNVVGKSSDEAKRLLEEAKLVVEAPSLSGTVAVQDPAAGKQVTSGTRVTIRLEVPDLKDLKSEDAVEAVRNRGWEVERTQEYSDTVEKGLIIRQERKDDKTITLVISKGEQPVDKVTVPNVVGMTLEEADKAIHDAGLKYWWEGDNTGRVVSQSPGAGSSAEKGSTVRFEMVGETTTTTEEETTTTTEETEDYGNAPDVMGMSLEKAISALRKAGYSVEYSGGGEVVTRQQVDEENKMVRIELR